MDVQEHINQSLWTMRLFPVSVAVGSLVDMSVCSGVSSSRGPFLRQGRVCRLAALIWIEIARLLPQEGDRLLCPRLHVRGLVHQHCASQPFGLSQANG